MKSLELSSFCAIDIKVVLSTIGCAGGINYVDAVANFNLNSAFPLSRTMSNVVAPSSSSSTPAAAATTLGTAVKLITTALPNPKDVITMFWKSRRLWNIVRADLYSDINASNRFLSGSYCKDNDDSRALGKSLIPLFDYLKDDPRLACSSPASGQNTYVNIEGKGIIYFCVRNYF